MASPLPGDTDDTVDMPIDDGGAVRVLHVEDDRNFADIAATFLERERDYFEIETRHHPEEGLAFLADADVDCVVSDYDMPEMDGLDLFEAVREDHPDLPFILFTGKGSEAIASEAISKGVTEYLQKRGGTEQYEVLANRIDQAVARYRAERQMTRVFRAVETAHDGISLLDDDGQFLYVNDAYARITGYDREELLGSHWKLLYADEEVDRVYEEMLPEAREGEWKGRTVYVRKDGDPVTVDHRLTYAEDGTLVCTISEVSEAEVVREELSLKERAMDEAPIGIVIAALDGDDNPIIYANDGFTELTGYSREEILGQDCRFLQGEKTREEPIRKMRDAIERAESVTVEVQNYRNDGRTFWNRVSIAPLFDEDGDLDYFVGFQQDVTEWKQEQNDE